MPPSTRVGSRPGFETESFPYFGCIHQPVVGHSCCEPLIHAPGVDDAKFGEGSHPAHALPDQRPLRLYQLAKEVAG